jgi:hypothetical protein
MPHCLLINSCHATLPSFFTVQASADHTVHACHEPIRIAHTYNARVEDVWGEEGVWEGLAANSMMLLVGEGIESIPHNRACMCRACHSCCNAR